jgi:hypothetical protein
VDARDAIGQTALTDELAVRENEAKRLVQPADALVDLAEEVSVACRGGYGDQLAFG